MIALPGPLKRSVYVCVLTGKILTIETVALKLSKKQWKAPVINPDQTCFHDEYMRHLLYITRIYFHYGLPEPELIGTLFLLSNKFDCDLTCSRKYIFKAEKK